MDSSILKLLEEDNEDESTISKEEFDVFQTSLLRELEGGNNSSSQQFAIQNNGIEDGNTNNLHIPESTQMKEEQQSALGNQGQELKPESEYHAQKNLPQDHRQRWENLSHVAQESNLQPSNDSISTEPERPQPLKQVISRRTHGLEQPVASWNHDPTQLEICELLRILILQADKDRGTQLLTLYSKFKRNEIPKDWFLRQVRGVMGAPMTRWAVSKLTEGNKGIKVPGGPDYSRESFTSAELSAKTPDTCGPHQVNFPAPAETILAGTIVRTTPKVPCVGQKKPLEALGSSLPPSSKKKRLCGTSLSRTDDKFSKKKRLCGTSLARSDDKFNDVTALGGINIMEEEEKLLSSRPTEDSRVSKAFRRVVHEEEGRMILQKVPLQRKLAEIMAKSGLKHINNDVERCLSLCVEERMRGLLSNIIRMSKQRTDPEKYRNRTCITSDLRKQINEMNQKAKEELERKHGGEGKLKNEENDAAKEDNPSEQANKKEQDERRTKAANVAALASIGGSNPFLKWKLVAEARQKPSSGPGRNSINLSVETGGSNQGSPKVVCSISVKDVIAAVEKEPQMSRSTLLYRLCNRIDSDAPTQEKT